MRLLVIALTVFCVCLSGASKKKTPDVEIVKIKAVREGAYMTMDGRIRATGEKPLPGLVLVFDFKAAGKVTVASKRVAIDELELQTGDESDFHVEADIPGKAYQFFVRALRNGDAEAAVANPGPYPIE